MKTLKEFMEKPAGKRKVTMQEFYDLAMSLPYRLQMVDWTMRRKDILRMADELNVRVPSVVWKCPRSSYGPGQYNLNWARMKQNNTDRGGE